MHIAAATSLNEVIQELALGFKQESGISIIPSFAATGQLSQQILNGAPYDVFAAADALHIDALIEKGYLDGESRTAYAQGELILVIQHDSTLAIRGLHDLARGEFERLAIANPTHAPYGIAAQEALTSAGVWENVEPKIIYAETVKQAAVIVSSGNADAGIIARSVLDPSLTLVEVIPLELHEPILHVAAISTSSARKHEAQLFLSYILSPRGQSILHEHGFSSP